MKEKYYGCNDDVFQLPGYGHDEAGSSPPGATLRLGNLIFEVVEVGEPQKNDEGTFTFPVHMVQRMEGEPHL